jgi:hypothetical protein
LDTDFYFLISFFFLFLITKKSQLWSVKFNKPCMYQPVIYVRFEVFTAVTRHHSSICDFFLLFCFTIIQFVSFLHVRLPDVWITSLNQGNGSQFYLCLNWDCHWNAEALSILFCMNLYTTSRECTSMVQMVIIFCLSCLVSSPSNNVIRVLSCDIC